MSSSDKVLRVYNERGEHKWWLVPARKDDGDWAGLFVILFVLVVA